MFKNIRISDTAPNSVSTSTLLCVTPNMKNSSHKTWQTLYLVLKPLQIQTLREKSGGDMAYYVPPVQKSGGTRPPCPPPNCAHVFDTLLYSQLGNKNYVAGHIKWSRGPQVLHPCTPRLIDRMLGRCSCLIVVFIQRRRTWKEYGGSLPANMWLWWAVSFCKCS